MQSLWCALAVMAPNAPVPTWGDFRRAVQVLIPHAEDLVKHVANPVTRQVSCFRVYLCDAHLQKVVLDYISIFQMCGIQVRDWERSQVWDRLFNEVAHVRMGVRLAASWDKASDLPKARSHRVWFKSKNHQTPKKQLQSTYK